MVAAAREESAEWTRAQMEALASLGAEYYEVGNPQHSSSLQARFLIFRELSAAIGCALILQELGDSEASLAVHELAGGTTHDDDLVRATQLVKRGGQGRVWVSRLVFDRSRREGLRWRSRSELAWLAHGTFKDGWDNALFELLEIGFGTGAKPLASSWSGAQRVHDATLCGWRPAKGQRIEGAAAWRLERLVSATPFSEKWQAIHREKQKRRFVELFWDRHCLERLRSQAFSLRQWQGNLKRCPKVVRLYHFDLGASLPFLATAVEEGEDLASKPELARAELPIKLFIAAQVAEILEAAHRCGVLHGELDTSDVLIRGQSGEIPTVQLRGFVVPKRPHDPRQTSGRRTVMHDYRALGLLLYRLLVSDLAASDPGGSMTRIRQPVLRDVVRALLEGLRSQPYNRLRKVVETLLGYEESSPSHSGWSIFRSRSIGGEARDGDDARRATRPARGAG